MTMQVTLEIHRPIGGAFMSRSSLVPIEFPEHSAYDFSRYSPVIQDAVRMNRARSDIFKSPLAQLRRATWLGKHRFRTKGRFCIDGRVSDLARRLGYDEGIMEMARSGGCKDHVVGGSWIGARRARDDNRKYRATYVNGYGDNPMTEFALYAAHHSVKHPTTHSCAAWGHNTDEGVAFMAAQANTLNRRLPGWVVAVHALVDTDTDTIRLFGPCGVVDTERFADSYPDDDEALTAGLLRMVRGAFPEDWEPLRTLKTLGHAAAFHSEIVEALVANVHSYREIRESGRAPELLDHQERLVFIGRPLEVEDPEDPEAAKRFFLVEDMEANVNATNVAIGMTYVTCNVIRDALRARNHDWKIPLVISIPHDPEDDDREITEEYARNIWLSENKNNPGLRLWLKENKIVMRDKIHARLKQEGLTDLSQSVLAGVENIVERTECLITVHDRRDRLWVPCE